MDSWMELQVARRLDFLNMALLGLGIAALAFGLTLEPLLGVTFLKCWHLLILWGYVHLRFCLLTFMQFRVGLPGLWVGMLGCLGL